MRRERKWFIAIVIGILISASLAAAASRWWHDDHATKISLVR
jgi:hypothetical protein